MNIFEYYTREELLTILSHPTASWPKNFRNFVNRQLANDLFDSWFENSDDEQYRDRVKDIIESFTG